MAVDPETRRYSPSTSRVDSDEVSNKPIIPRLKRDDIGINVTPTVHAKAVTTSPGVLISTSAKHRRERAVTNVSIFFI